MRKASEILRQLMCASIANEYIPEEADAVTLWECLELYTALVRAETLAEVTASAAPPPPESSPAPEEPEAAAKPEADAGAAQDTEAAPPKNVAGAVFKKETAERLRSWRTANGPGCFTPLAECCGKGFDADKLRQMAAGYKFPLSDWRAVAAGMDRLEAVMA